MATQRRSKTKKKVGALKNKKLSPESARGVMGGGQIAKSTAGSGLFRVFLNGGTNPKA